MIQLIRVILLPFLLGAIAGFALSQGVSAFGPDINPSLSILRPREGSYSPRIYNGIVREHEPLRNRIRIFVENSYSRTGDRSGVVFQYDEKTVWASTEYVFDNNGIVVQERIDNDKPLQLPPGAAVRIIEDPHDGDRLRAEYIIVIKRDTL